MIYDINKNLDYLLVLRRLLFYFSIFIKRENIIFYILLISKIARVDLFYIKREDFDRILKTTLLEEWDILQDAMVNFNYFKGWDQNMIRECCILSKVKNYKPNEVWLLIF